MKKIRFSLMIVLTLSLLVANTAQGQSEELVLTMSRDWGYGGFNNDIQGLFSMHISGPDTLVKVEFHIDDLKIGEDNEFPFALQFTTDDHPLGLHALSAIGSTSDGQILDSNIITANFVSASEGTDAAIKIAGPILGIALLAILLSVGVPLIVTRGKRESLPLGEERNYGIRGGGICPKCHRPFVIHLWGMNLGLSKYDRCPYCGKWSVIRVRSIAKLREAEKAELAWAKAEAPQLSEEEKQRKDLDDSKYQGT